MATGFVGPQGNLGPVEKGPFYAIPIHYGTLGTNSGPRINENGQVINVRGNVVSGPYAAGNAVMGIHVGQTAERSIDLTEKTTI